jgi:hypothetical protein
MERVSLLKPADLRAALIYIKTCEIGLHATTYFGHRQLFNVSCLDDLGHCHCQFANSFLKPVDNQTVTVQCAKQGTT